jgi:flagellar hook-associated protein 1 FlgK
MGTLASIFDLSRSALSADQVALNATANNVANQNTAGYVRQTVSFSEGDQVTINGQTTISGPTATAVSKRDRVLEQRVQQQTQTQSDTSAHAAVLGQIENVFGISGSTANAGSTEIGTALDGLASSFTALEGNPSDTATRQAVLSAATSLASAFNTAANALQSVQTNLNANLSDATTEVNSLTTRIADLNTQIGSQGSKADAGTLEDQRQQAIAQLSQYIGLDQVATENNGITLTTRGGTPLVNGPQAFALHASIVAGTTVISDSSGASLNASIVGGSIGGELAGQGTDLPAAQSALDQIAFRVASAVNAQNAAGVDLSGAPGKALFTLTPTSVGAAAAVSLSVSDPSLVAAAGVGEGVTGNSNANRLAGLLQQADANGTTPSGQLAALLSNVGSTSSRLQEQSTAQTASLTQLTTQRDSLSAVSLDTEAANLSQYQRSYQAASRLFTILDSLIVSSLNLGQQTAFV